MPDPSPPSRHDGTGAVDLRVDGARAAELKEAARAWPSWTLTELQLADLELLATGAYAPLTGFMTEEDHASILVDDRLPDGPLWPVPILLDVDTATANAADGADHVALRDAEGTMLAALTVTSRWRPDLRAEAHRLLGSDDPAHPEVAALIERSGAMRLGGPLEVLELPAHHDLEELRATPDQLRGRLAGHGDRPVLAVHLRGIPSTRQLDVIRERARDLGAVVLLHPVVGPGEAVDLDRFTRVRLARLAAEHLRHDVEVELAVTPLPARLMGPREAVLHALVRRNHGASHVLIGPWHASPHAPERVAPLDGPQAPPRRVGDVADELGITPVLHWDGEEGAISANDVNPVTEVPYGTDAADPGQALLARARDGAYPLGDVPDDVDVAVRRVLPTRDERGLCVFFTGLSGSGKSTIAKILRARLLEPGGRTVTLLDGDLVRRNLSSELDFSKEHRDLNVLRIGYVASEIAKHGGIAICAPIAPYDAIRRANREQITRHGGGYVLVHVATPLDVCEARDRKGLYARARAGEITGFTGIDDPYEVPDDAALTIDTTDLTPRDAADRVLAHLEEEGWWPPRT
jgi:sulfate adenylyltransferase